jgi:hypothetical protein
MRWVIAMVAAGVVLAGAGPLSAHDGVDDGDDGEPGAGGAPSGTALEELYPGYYEFQRRFLSWSGAWTPTGAPGSIMTATIPAGQAALPLPRLTQP